MPSGVKTLQVHGTDGAPEDHRHAPCREGGNVDLQALPAEDRHLQKWGERVAAFPIFPQQGSRRRRVTDNRQGVQTL